MMPTPAPTITAAAIDHGATDAGSGVKTETSLASPIPNEMPMMAPITLRVAASTRNWRRMSF